MSRQSRWSKGGGDCTSSPSHLSLVRHSPARASNGGQTRVTSTQRRREDASERRTMGDRGGTGGGRPRARGEDPTATAFNPLYAGRSAGAASRGRGAGSEGKKGSEAEVWSDEELIYAEVFSARFGSADGGQERRCSSAELCGYLICPLTAVGLALGALVLAVLLLRGVLTPLELSKELVELRAAVEALQRSVEALQRSVDSVPVPPPPPALVPIGLRTTDYGSCIKQSFSCSLNGSSNTCGLELGPVHPSYIRSKQESLTLSAHHCWYQLLEGPDTSRVSLQLFLREIRLGNYSSADMFCLATSRFSASERGVVHLYHRDCPLKDYVLLTI